MEAQTYAGLGDKQKSRLYWPVVGYPSAVLIGSETCWYTRFLRESGKQAKADRMVASTGYQLPENRIALMAAAVYNGEKEKAAGMPDNLNPQRSGGYYLRGSPSFLTLTLI